MFPFGVLRMFDLSELFLKWNNCKPLTDIEDVLVVLGSHPTGLVPFPQGVMSTVLIL
jgi:hypothetical protein